MTNHPSPTQAASAATLAAMPLEPAEPLAERVAALELFVQQLLLVLEGEGVMNTDALMHWMTLARSRMLMTGSVPPRTVVALSRLQRQVAQ